MPLRHTPLLLLSLLAIASAPANPSVHHPKPAAPAEVAPKPLPVPIDRLMEAQQGLVEKMVASLPARATGRANLYAIAVAASGRQQLFSREAHLALEVAAARFGPAYRGGALLSNGAPDLLQAPMATRANVLLTMDGLSHRIDPAEDVAFVYLASHGAADASLETDLPDLEDFRAISAPFLADALAQSGIRRRIIVISACFSGSWIRSLANDDTIIVTAAQSDRTSFGCDDKRQLTYFGQAFLQGPLAKGASLQASFEAAKRSVAGWEAAQKLLPSEPQAFVGRNMQGLWAEAR